MWVKLTFFHLPYDSMRTMLVRVVVIKETGADLEERIFIKDINYRSVSFGDREGDSGQNVAIVSVG